MNIVVFQKYFWPKRMFAGIKHSLIILKTEKFYGFACKMLWNVPLVSTPENPQLIYYTIYKIHVLKGRE